MEAETWEEEDEVEEGVCGKSRVLAAQGEERREEVITSRAIIYLYCSLDMYVCYGSGCGGTE